jgi:hypothetical protein
MWSVAKSYMKKCANISPYVRRPFVIYDFGTDPFWIFLYMRKIFLSFYPCIYALLMICNKWIPNSKMAGLSSISDHLLYLWGVMGRIWSIFEAISNQTARLRTRMQWLAKAACTWDNILSIGMTEGIDVKTVSLLIFKWTGFPSVLRN